MGLGDGEDLDVGGIAPGLPASLADTGADCVRPALEFVEFWKHAGVRKTTSWFT
jgi:hypothetical protein